MKNFISLTAILATLLFTSVVQTSCTKKPEDPTGPKEELAPRKWIINRIQLRLYSGSTFLKDTILPYNPKPSNFVDFSGGSFKYCYNTTTIDAGTYQFKGTDSLIATTPANTYNWKMLTLTKELFTVVSSSSNDPAFPGLRVERYQTWVP